jgi:hypothetical protein
VVGGAHRVTIQLHGSSQAAAMAIVVPKSAKLRSIDIHGQHLVAPKDSESDTLLGCASRDCASETIGLVFESRSQVLLQIAEQRYDLPPLAARLVAARPENAIPSQTGDYTLLANTLTVKAQ